MSTFFSLTKKWQPFLKKYALAVMIITGVLFVLILGMIFFGDNQEIIVRQKVFIMEANEEISKEAETYLMGLSNPDQAIIKFDDIDMSRLGKYIGFITYEDIDYEINIEVVDTKKPEIKLEKEKFIFRLDTTLENINNELNEAITITDNYDKDFEEIIIVEQVSEEEKEITIRLSVKDTSGNVSNSVKFIIQFTEDGSEKEELAKEEKTVIISLSRNQAEQANSDEDNNSNKSEEQKKESSETEGAGSSDSNGSDRKPSTEGNTGTLDGENKPESKPEPTPTPTPETKPSAGVTPTPESKPEPTPTPTPTPESKPSTEVTPTPEPTPDPEPEYVCPNGVIDKMKPCDYYEFEPVSDAIDVKFFNTSAERNAWAVNNINNETHSGVRSSVKRNDGSFLYVLEVVER